MLSINTENQIPRAENLNTKNQIHRAGKRTEERNQDQEIRRKQYKKGEIAEPRKLTKGKLRMFKLKIGKKIFFKT